LGGDVLHNGTGQRKGRHNRHANQCLFKHKGTIRTGACARLSGEGRLGSKVHFGEPWPPKPQFMVTPGTRVTRALQWGEPWFSRNPLAKMVHFLVLVTSESQSLLIHACTNGSIP
jgi:hypothetical protein